MSVVIACKFNNGVVIASDRQVTRGYEKVEDKISKVQKIDGKSIIIGGVGSLRDIQKMKAASTKLFSTSDKLTENECIKIINNISSVYQELGLIETGKIIQSLDGEYLFVDSYNINFVGYDLGVISGFDYYVIGSGNNLATGYLNVEFKDKNPNDLTSENIIKILKNAIKVSCKNNITIDDNVDIYILYKDAIDLIDDSNIEIINKCEYDMLDKSKPKSECNKNCESCPHSLRIIYSKKDKTIKTLSTN